MKKYVPFKKTIIPVLSIIMIIVALLVFIYTIDNKKFNKDRKNNSTDYILRVVYLIGNEETLDKNITIDETIYNHFSNEGDIVFTANENVPLTKKDNYLYVDLDNHTNPILLKNVVDSVFAKNNPNGEVLDGCEYDKKTNVIKIPLSYYEEYKKGIPNVQVEVESLLKWDDLSNVKVELNNKKLVTSTKSINSNSFSLETDFDLDKVFYKKLSKSNIKIYLNDSNIPLSDDSYNLDTKTGKVSILAPSILIKSIDVKHSLIPFKSVKADVTTTIEGMNALTLSEFSSNGDGINILTDIKKYNGKIIDTSRSSSGYPSQVDGAVRLSYCLASGNNPACPDGSNFNHNVNNKSYLNGTYKYIYYLDENNKTYKSPYNSSENNIYSNSTYVYPYSININDLVNYMGYTLKNPPLSGHTAESDYFLPLYCLHISNGANSFTNNENVHIRLNIVATGVETSNGVINEGWVLLKVYMTDQNGKDYGAVRAKSENKYQQAMGYLKLKWNAYNNETILKVEKKVEGSNYKIEGLTIYAAKNALGVVEEQKTDANGIATFTNLSPNTRYRFYEDCNSNVTVRDNNQIISVDGVQIQNKKLSDAHIKCSYNSSRNALVPTTVPYSYNAGNFGDLKDVVFISASDNDSDSKYTGLKANVGNNGFHFKRIEGLPSSSASSDSSIKYVYLSMDSDHYNFGTYLANIHNKYPNAKVYVGPIPNTSKEINGDIKQNCIANGTYCSFIDSLEYILLTKGDNAGLTNPMYLSGNKLSQDGTYIYVSNVARLISPDLTTKNTPSASSIPLVELKNTISPDEQEEENYYCLNVRKKDVSASGQVQAGVDGVMLKAICFDENGTYLPGKDAYSVTGNNYNSFNDDLDRHGWATFFIPTGEDEISYCMVSVIDDVTGYLTEGQYLNYLNSRSLSHVSKNNSGDYYIDESQIECNNGVVSGGDCKNQGLRVVPKKLETSVADDQYAINMFFSARENPRIASKYGNNYQKYGDDYAKIYDPVLCKSTVVDLDDTDLTIPEYKVVLNWYKDYKNPSSANKEAKFTVKQTLGDGSTRYVKVSSYTNEVKDANLNTKTCYEFDSYTNDESEASIFRESMQGETCIYNLDYTTNIQGQKYNYIVTEISNDRYTTSGQASNSRTLEIGADINFAPKDDDLTISDNNTLTNYNKLIQWKKKDGSTGLEADGKSFVVEKVGKGYIKYATNNPTEFLDKDNNRRLCYEAYIDNDDSNDYTQNINEAKVFVSSDISGNGYEHGSVCVFNLVAKDTDSFVIKEVNTDAVSSGNLTLRATDTIQLNVPDSSVITNYPYLIDFSKIEYNNGITNNSGKPLKGAKFNIVDSNNTPLKTAPNKKVLKDRNGVEKSCYYVDKENPNNNTNSLFESDNDGYICIFNTVKDMEYTVNEVEIPTYYTIGENYTDGHPGFKVRSKLLLGNPSSMVNCATEVKFKKTTSEMSSLSSENRKIVFEELKNITFHVYSESNPTVPLKFVYNANSGRYEYGPAVGSQAYVDLNGTTDLRLLNGISPENATLDDLEIILNYLPFGNYKIEEVASKNCDSSTSGSSTSNSCTCGSPTSDASHSTSAEANCSLMGYKKIEPIYFTIDQSSRSSTTCNNAPVTDGYVYRITNKPTEVPFTKKDLYSYYSGDKNVKFENEEEVTMFDNITFRVRKASNTDLNNVNATTNDKYEWFYDLENGEYRYDVLHKCSREGQQVAGYTCTQNLHTERGDMKLTHLCKCEEYYIEEYEVPDGSLFILPRCETKNNDGTSVDHSTDGNCTCAQGSIKVNKDGKYECHPAKEIKVCDCGSDTPDDSPLTLIENLPTRQAFIKKDTKYNTIITSQEVEFELYLTKEEAVNNGRTCNPYDEESKRSDCTQIYFSERVKQSGGKFYEDDHGYVYRFLNDQSSSNRVGTLKLDPNNGKIVLRYLPSYITREYVLMETKADSSYTLPLREESVTRFIVKNDTVNVDISNVPNRPTRAIISKLDAATGNLLPGAHFKLYKVNNYDENLSPMMQSMTEVNLKTIRAGSYEYRDPKDTNIITTCIDTDASLCSDISYVELDDNYDENVEPTTVTIKEGQALIEYLDGDSYYVIEEVKVPEGYKLPERESDRYSIFYVPKLETKIEELKIYNTESFFTFYKYDEFNRVKDGAVFKLQKLNNDKIYEDVTVEDVSTEDTKIYKVNSESSNIDITTLNGSATIYRLTEGQYRIIETKAPEGYELPKKSYNVVTFLVDKNGHTYGQNIIANKKKTAHIEVVPKAEAELVVNIQTGQKVIKYGLIITGILGLIGLLIFIRKKVSK